MHKIIKHFAVVAHEYSHVVGERFSADDSSFNIDLDAPVPGFGRQYRDDVLYVRAQKRGHVRYIGIVYRKFEQKK